MVAYSSLYVGGGHTGLAAHRAKKRLKQVHARVQTALAVTPPTYSTSGAAPVTITFNFGSRVNAGAPTFSTFVMKAYEWAPTVAANGWTLLHHHGHTAVEDTTIQDHYRGLGYSVISLFMPGYVAGAPSGGAGTIDAGNCTVYQASHGDDPSTGMALCTPQVGHDPFNGLDYLLGPTIAVLDYLDATRPSDHIAMLGLSGGGWVTTLAAAKDDRIEKAYSVAGIVPHWLAENAPAVNGDPGDWEQRIKRKWHSYASVYDLFAAACTPSRRFVWMLNNNDPTLGKYTAASATFDRIETYVKNLVASEGDFDMEVYTNSNHSINNAARDFVHTDIAP